LANISEKFCHFQANSLPFSLKKLHFLTQISEKGRNFLFLQRFFMNFSDYLNQSDLYAFFAMGGMSFHWADQISSVAAKKKILQTQKDPFATGPHSKWHKTMWLRLGHRQKLTTYGEILSYFVKEMMIPLHLAGKDVNKNALQSPEDKHLEISHHSAHGPYQHFFAFRWVDRQDVLFALWQLLLAEDIPQRQFRLRLQPQHYTQSSYYWQQYLMQGMTIKGHQTAEEWKNIQQQGMSFPWGSFIQLDEFLHQQDSKRKTLLLRLDLKERLFDAAKKIKLRPESFHYIKGQAEILSQYSVHQSFSPPSLIVHWDDMIFIHQNLRKFLTELITEAQQFIEEKCHDSLSLPIMQKSPTPSYERKGLSSIILDLFEEVKETRGQQLA
jgi:hypothetical protein